MPDSKKNKLNNQMPPKAESSFKRPQSAMRSITEIMLKADERLNDLSVANNLKTKLKPSISVENLKDSSLTTNKQFIELINVIENYNFNNRKSLLENKTINTYENMLMTNLYQMIIELDRINDHEKEIKCLEKVYEWYNQKIVSTYINKITKSRDNLHAKRDQIDDNASNMDEQPQNYNYEANFDAMNDINNMKGENFDRLKQTKKDENRRLEDDKSDNRSNKSRMSDRVVVEQSKDIVDLGLENMSLQD